MKCSLPSRATARIFKSMRTASIFHLKIFLSLNLATTTHYHICGHYRLWSELHWGLSGIHPGLRHVWAFLVNRWIRGTRNLFEGGGEGQRKKEVKLTVSLNKNILGKGRSNTKRLGLILFCDFHAPSQQPRIPPVSPSSHFLLLHLPSLRDLGQSLRGEAINRNIGELPS